MSSSQPLLSSSSSSFSSQHPSIFNPPPRLVRLHHLCRNNLRAFLSSRAQHYTVLALVSCDLLSIFADIIINLYQCDQKDTAREWDAVRNGLGIAGLVFSCMFMLELVASLWAFGWRCVAVISFCFGYFLIPSFLITYLPTMLYICARRKDSASSTHTSPSPKQKHTHLPSPTPVISLPLSTS